MQYEYIVKVRYGDGRPDYEVLIYARDSVEARVRAEGIVRAANARDYTVRPGARP